MIDEKIDYFFNKKLITNSNTQRGYRGNIRRFFVIINKDVDSYFSKDKTLEDYDDDLIKAYSQIEKENTPYLTRRTFFNSVKQFMITYDKRIKELDFWDILKTHLRGASPISKEHITNAQDIKTILNHADAKGKAMFLIMASSGLRIGELLALHETDINMTINPTLIDVTKTYDRKKQGNVSTMTKTKRPRKCFISSEATEFYLEWLKIRDKYLKTSTGKTNKKYKKDAKDKRIFPMSDENARKIWENLVIKSNLFTKEELKDAKTKRLVLHPHCLRKFFRSYFGNSDLAEHLMGHATGMDKHYRNMKIEDLANEYLKTMENVMIFSKRSKDILDMSERLENKDKELTELKDNLKLMELRMQGLENKLDIETLKNSKKR